jgi:hypothetical protein
MELPMAAPRGCALDNNALRSQIGRYQQIGRHGRTVTRDARRIVIEFSDVVDSSLVERIIATEAKCCPFLEIDWNNRTRRLTIAVSSTEHEPVIAAITDVLTDQRGV